MRKILEQFRLVWLLLLPLLFSLPYYFLFPTWTEWALFSGGCLLGAVLLLIDEKIGHQWYQEINVDSSYADVLHLITRSLVFIGVYIPLAIFIVTSSGSPLGMGLVMGLGLGIVLEMWLWGVHPELFQQRFGWQINHRFTAANVQQVTGFFALFLAIVSLLIVLA